MSSGKSGITNMNLENKVSSRLTELRSRRGAESGYVDLYSIIAISIILWVAIGFVVFANAIADNAITQSIAEETKTAYDMIYDDYLDHAQGIHDEDELNQILKFSTEKYGENVEVDAVVESRLVTQEIISVTLSMNPYSATFTTGDDEPEVKRVMVPAPGNDIHDIEVELNFD